MVLFTLIATVVLPFFTVKVITVPSIPSGLSSGSMSCAYACTVSPTAGVVVLKDTTTPVGPLVVTSAVLLRLVARLPALYRVFAVTFSVALAATVLFTVKLNLTYPPEVVNDRLLLTCVAESNRLRLPST